MKILTIISSTVCAAALALSGVTFAKAAEAEEVAKDKAFVEHHHDKHNSNHHGHKHHGKHHGKHHHKHGKNHKHDKKSDEGKAE